MSRIAIVDNEKLKDEALKLHVQKSCPVNRTGTECIKIEEDGLLTIDETLCTGCGICPKLAPKAIKIINLPEALEQTPVHRYGENSFVLYSLPTPLFENVVGILGVNGIGKSTALKILARITHPNFGDYEREQADTDFEELISYFKGTEAQGFFEKVSRGEIVISYKPQQVELIPKTAKGSVRALLEQVNERDMFDEICAELSLTKFLDRDISQISGGELQRVAIAASVLKKANLYIFDEPTSYLDIKQRIRISRFIKSLANAETSVLVVDHDLIILDYIADLVHIMYGQESGYGIVSGVKPVKRGINVYLDGYLREENIRFRHSITFEEHPPVVAREKEALVSWDALTKKLGTFSLVSKEGCLYKKDVVGVVGENGIGKTTFVKILAGVIESDTGKVHEDVKVSYKPQYIEASDELVMSALSTAFRKYTNQLIKPLNIEILAEKKLNELSGGELQRVAIVHCLQQEADLYLLDEPSAYLDSEQRLTLSKVLKDFMEQTGSTALVVDHDLLFVDYICDSLMVFSGTPAEKGVVTGPFEKREGMNLFLRDLDITLRRDEHSHRPRVNKKDSRLDRAQKQKGSYYS